MLEDGRVVERAPAEAAVGTSFGVRPGDKIPLDGRVIRGRARSTRRHHRVRVPVLKHTGDAVFAGTSTVTALEVESTKPASDTTLAHIARLVGEAQGQRAL